MKKILIATAAVAALAAGASAAQAKVHFNLYLDAPHYYAPAGYGYDYEPDCHYVTIKKVKWVNGYKVVKFKQKLVCNTY